MSHNQEKSKSVETDPEMAELMEFESRHVKPVITYLLCMFKKIEENVTDEQRN